MDIAPRKELEETYITLFYTAEISQRALLNHALNFFSQKGIYPIISDNEYTRICIFLNNLFKSIEDRDIFFSGITGFINEELQNDYLIHSESKRMNSELNDERKKLSGYKDEDLVLKIENLNTALSDPNEIWSQIKNIFYDKITESEIETIDYLFQQRIESIKKERILRLNLSLNGEEKSNEIENHNYLFESDFDYKLFVCRKLKNIGFNVWTKLSQDKDKDNVSYLISEKQCITINHSFKDYEFTKTALSYFARDNIVDINVNDYFNAEYIEEENNSVNTRGEVWIISQKGFSQSDIKLVNSIKPKGLCLGVYSIKDREINWIYKNHEINSDLLKINQAEIIKARGYDHALSIIQKTTINEEQEFVKAFSEDTGMSLSIKLSQKGKTLISKLNKKRFNRIKKESSYIQTMKLIIESAARSKLNKRFSCYWKDVVKDIEESANFAEADKNLDLPGLVPLELTKKSEYLIEHLKKEIFKRRRKKVTSVQVLETLFESAAKCCTDQRYKTSWKNLVKDIEEASEEQKTPTKELLTKPIKKSNPNNTTEEKIQLLQEETGDCYEDCENALIINDGDMTDSIYWLKEGYKYESSQTTESETKISNHGSFKLVKAKENEFQYVPDDHLFTIEDIAKMVNKKWGEVNDARIKLNLEAKGSFSQKDSALIIDYIADPSKYQQHLVSKTEVVKESKMTSSDWALVIGIGAIAVGGIAWLLTRNNNAARLAYTGTNAAFRGTQAATTGYALAGAGSVATYSMAQAVARKAIMSSIIGFVSTKTGISPLFMGPRGGVFRYTLGGSKSYL